MSTADPPPSAPGLAPSGLYVDARDPTYPDSDGKPMAESTQQFDWIVTIEEGLEALFDARPDVFVAGDLLWYYTEGVVRDCVAPDAMVVFGRPKGRRYSYRQWLEGGLAPQVVFEVYSHANTPAEMARKLNLYDRLGVEEYYEYDPRGGSLKGWLRDGARMRPIPEVDGWRSPRLGVTFESPPEEDALVIRRPDGTPFVTAVQAMRQRDEEARRADEEARRADEAERRARAEHRLADAAHRRAEEAEERAERLAAMLREMGLNPD
ncbi:Uma2 family endonuclease [Paludisphaera sp.]|uniref:Uma2 family endonuclease n=1 Tax=Paludisphaera sp. TaxID=2017432 RepID=UPI00301CE150